MAPLPDPCDPTFDWVEKMNGVSTRWLTDEVVAALKRERHRLGEVNPLFSYYQRLVDDARLDSDKLHRIHSHVVKHGGFQGL